MIINIYMVWMNTHAFSFLGGYRVQADGAGEPHRHLHALRALRGARPQGRKMGDLQ